MCFNVFCFKLLLSLESILIIREKSAEFGFYRSGQTSLTRNWCAVKGSAEYQEHKEEVMPALTEGHKDRQVSVRQRPNQSEQAA